MILINLFFVIVGFYFTIHFVNEGGPKSLIFLNMLSAVLNLVPVVVELLK